LITGLLLLDPGRFSGLYAVKVAAGLIAVLGNILCVIPVLQRRAAAESGDLQGVIRLSRQVDFISVLAIPAGLVALSIGIFLAITR